MLGTEWIDAQLAEVNRKTHILWKLERVQRPGHEHIRTMQQTYSEILTLLDSIGAEILAVEMHYFMLDDDEAPEEETKDLDSGAWLQEQMWYLRQWLRSLDMHEDELRISGFRWRRRDY